KFKETCGTKSLPDDQTLGIFNKTTKTMDEKTICEVSPSQLLNLKAFVYSILAIAVIVTASILANNSLILIALILPIAYAFWKYLQIASIKLKITDERIIIREGVLNKT